MNISEFYRNAIAPLGIKEFDPSFKISPHASDLAYIEQILASDGLTGKRLIGINIGAGHPSRFWSIENFSRLAGLSTGVEDSQVVVFFGPEEEGYRAEILDKMPADVVIYDQLNLMQLAAMFSRLTVLVGSDTGPVHLAASLGTQVIFVSNPQTFYPPGENVHVAAENALEDINAETVFQKLQSIMV